MDIKPFIRTIPDHPLPGIQFRDLTTLLSNAPAFEGAINALVEIANNYQPDLIVGIEARGFIVASAMALQMKKGFIPIRKSGKLPYKVYKRKYELEYGSDMIEIHVDAIDKGQKVLLVDDLIATGGTAKAAVELLRECGGIVDAALFLIDLPELGGTKKLEKLDLSIHSLAEYAGH